ncbi:MAG: 3-phosphoserine/phosphohydroxythreonine transaminase [Thermogutta sp.]|nr:3-phosphoserine/phosphohydroxythreonine transaminase [Thermogutta sp.]
MTQRVYNFAPGPAVLPEPALEEAQRNLMALPGVGMSVLEISHRSAAFSEIIQGAERNLRTLLQIPEDYAVLFLQGGAKLQFGMVPMNFLRNTGARASYIVSGTWSKQAAAEAAGQGQVHVAWDGKATNYDRVPADDQLNIAPDSIYVYLCSNETIAGVQFPREPETNGIPLVCDASSELLSRPVDIRRYGILFACAQKNLGPAGVTVVIIRKDFLDRCPNDLPMMLNYRQLAEHNSLLNTPPVFAVYMVKLVTDWVLREFGDLQKLKEFNEKKAALLYDAIASCGGFYTVHAAPGSRSAMNIAFRLPNAETEKKFLAESRKVGLYNLEGHRSVGGCRASIYNAMPWEGVVALRDFMLQFYQANRDQVG